jgi:tellurium resistance protein TerD
MINLEMKTNGSYDSSNVLNINQLKVEGAKSAANIATYKSTPNIAPSAPTTQSVTQPYPTAPNVAQPYPSAPNVTPAYSSMQNVTPAYSSMQNVTPAYSSMQNVAPTYQSAQYAAPTYQQPTQSVTQPAQAMPSIGNVLQKGQKVSLENNFKLSQIQARLGWDVLNPACDVDVSAFMLGNTGKVIGDNWFVFYGQTTSPDNSTVFSVTQGQDREIISIDFTKLNPAVSRIVFVLTINEALEKNLNFSMIQNAYVKIFDTSSNTELVNFKMDEYYSNVTSMMIGEVYQNNGVWKFNAIGNGVAKDLAGLCELYGVNIA